MTRKARAQVPAIDVNHQPKPSVWQPLLETVLAVVLLWFTWRDILPQNALNLVLMLAADRTQQMLQNPLPIMGLGIFAGSVQALIFSTLAAAYICEALE